MTAMRDAAMTSKAWPFEEARRLLKRYESAPPEKGYVLFETGYGPSGLPHIGTFGEVLRTTMIRRAFEVISDIPTKLICFSDDLDGMRKVPGNVPQQEMLKEYLQMPLTSVPDPFGTHESFGDHNNEMLKRFLDTFGFEYEFYSARTFYKSGQFDEILLRCAERYDDLMKIMLKSLREERAETYSIFLPMHPETGRVLYVPMKHVDAAEGTVTFDDEEGREWTVPVTGGNVKLQWKPDFGARWAALGVDFEMYGKEHATNEKIYDATWSGDRKPGADGKLPPVGNTVDLKTATYTDAIGNNELLGHWTDPDFDSATPAYYYARVLQIPTPRWSTYDAVRSGKPLLDSVPAVVQERAWTSPIWYRPPSS